MYQQQPPCQDIQQTLTHIRAHIAQVLTLEHKGAQVVDVSKRETPTGAYTFRLSGVVRPDTAVSSIKKAIGDSYVQNHVDRGYGTVDIVILAEAFDRDTYAQASNLFNNYAASRGRGVGIGFEERECECDDDNDDGQKSRSPSKNKIGKKNNDTTIFGGNKVHLVFLYLAVFLLGALFYIYVSDWIAQIKH
jgi:hypothetical protein